MTASGWCRAAPGARVPHEQCRCLTCTCDCPHEWRNAPKVRGSEAISVGDPRYDGATNTNGPERCVNTVISGPRRSTEEID